MPVRPDTWTARTDAGAAAFAPTPSSRRSWNPAPSCGMLGIAPVPPPSCGKASPPSSRSKQVSVRRTIGLVWRSKRRAARTREPQALGSLLCSEASSRVISSDARPR